MNELISVSYDNDRPTVLGRDLHEKLGIKTPYTQWFERMTEYGFTENVDYMTFHKNVTRADGTEMPKPQMNHQLTLDMAKQICMIQRSDLGRQYREYFLEIERKWNDPVTSMARSLVYANRQLASVTGQLEAANRQIEADRPKVVFADAVSASEGSILVREMAKILNQNGVKEVGGEKRLYAWLREHGYLTKSNQPMQRYMERGLFEVTEGVYQKPDGCPFVSLTTRITGKGQQYFINLFVKEEA
jgi:anti-repressor protein